MKLSLATNPLQTSLLADCAEPAELRGETATRADTVRLSGQYAQVEALMSDGTWHTLPGLAKELRRQFGTQYAETSISARLRDMRRKGWAVHAERSRLVSGLYQYHAVKEAGLAA